jgi:hypothetical protein
MPKQVTYFIVSLDKEVFIIHVFVGHLFFAKIWIIGIAFITIVGIEERIFFALV